jgi:allantoin racemase
VLCGPLALVQQGQAAVKLRRAMGGRFTSRRGAYGQPPPGQIAELRRYYGVVYPDVVP